MNNSTSKQNNPVFEIGLVLAGAVSAGAYSAGVMDFLIEAIDKWYAAKEDEISRGVNLEDRKIPTHDISIKAISGASAGSMVAALAAVALNEPLNAIDPRSSPDNNDDSNKFYSSWVMKARIEEMLGIEDLEDPNSPLSSLLNCSFLERLANETLNIRGDVVSRTYVADCLPLYLCVTNLRGVPYSIDFRGLKVIEHGMSNHADFLRFELVKTVARDKVKLDPSSITLHPVPENQEEKAAWATLAEAALASGAFPLALAPRILHRKTKDYDDRIWLIPHSEPKPEGDFLVCAGQDTIIPAWNIDEVKKYSFVAVDGGVMNNEPMEYVRQELAGIGRHNERDGNKADRAVIMIDPFPNRVIFKPDYKPETNMRNIVGSLFSSLMSQAKFKADELKLARDASVFSRFFIAPSRSKTEREKPKDTLSALASNSLGHFGGFLCEDFRRHDFLLGRRNCQSFLQNYFMLPIENSLFSTWPKDIKQPGSPFLRSMNVDGKEIICLPIIPLVDELSDPNREKKQLWPIMANSDLKGIEHKLKKRVKVVTKRMVSGLGGMSKVLVNLIVPWISGWVTKKISKTIRENLKEMELIE